MRWRQLFDDLEAQWEAVEVAAERGQTASRTRAEHGTVRLADRVAGALGEHVSLRCRGAGVVAGVLTDTGPGWVLVEDGRGRETLVATAAVRSITDPVRRTAPAGDPGPVRRHLDLRWAARVLARNRSPVRLVLDDGAVLDGTVDRVGADFLELAEHPPDEPRRARAVRAVHAVALDAVAAVVRAAEPTDRAG
ncbi:hypothetical protein OF117_04550 [Geodermatophilus sp. YIM 151500]|uniref:hypothetical protein n=1 Tax=Geodermatophilus sp. YIM 151500 TaxID=2984531 RepID=UPI0021E4D962|nr:hypothetical protein [Geodermatophilus sp. YIM 151500]MCV2488624.1 hypothetical protein [Geodermatophilus sp. YIM 151500]